MLIDLWNTKDICIFTALKAYFNSMTIGYFKKKKGGDKTEHKHL